jgi:hypothetical protein
MGSSVSRQRQRNSKGYIVDELPIAPATAELPGGGHLYQDTSGRLPDINISVKHGAFTFTVTTPPSSTYEDLRTRLAAQIG